jgi:hypothetical protein
MTITAVVWVKHNQRLCKLQCRFCTTGARVQQPWSLGTGMQSYKACSFLKRQASMWPAVSLSGEWHQPVYSPGWPWPSFSVLEGSPTAPWRQRWGRQAGLGDALEASPRVGQRATTASQPAQPVS